MFLRRRIDNRHILCSAFFMVLLNLLVLGALGVRPPQWFSVSQQRAIIHGMPKVLVQDTPKISVQDTPKALAQDTAHDNLPSQPIKSPLTMFQAPLVAGTTIAQSRPDLNRVPEEPDVSANPSVLIITADFSRKIPLTHLELSGDAQKHSFVDLILPLIVASNNELLQRRDAVKSAAAGNNRIMLEKWAALYRVETENLDNAGLAERLLRRVDVIPVALALAQAAVESGWGTSRFALQGNALFGQWAWTQSAGIRPLAASNERAVVRSFGSLLESVRAYMHNLNTHSNYQRFRDARQRLKLQNETVKANELAHYLDSYAEIGIAYVDKLRAIILSNNFNKYARARLG